MSLGFVIDNDWVDNDWDPKVENIPVSASISK
jgi:hypothetical protein